MKVYLMSEKKILRKKSNYLFCGSLIIRKIYGILKKKKKLKGRQNFSYTTYINHAQATYN